MNTNDSDRECLFPSLVVCTENIVNRRWLFFSIFLWEIIHSNMGHGDRICYAMHPARFRQTRTNYLHTQKKEDPPARVARDHLYMHPRRDIKWAGGDVLPLNRRLAWTAWTTNNLKCKQRDSDRSHGVMPTHIYTAALVFSVIFMFVLLLSSSSWLLGCDWQRFWFCICIIHAIVRWWLCGN